MTKTNTFDYGKFVGSVTTRFDSIDESMKRMEDRQEKIIDIMAKYREKRESEDKCRDERIESIDKKQTFFAGAIAVVTFIVTVTINWVMNLLRGG